MATRPLLTALITIIVVVAAIMAITYLAAPHTSQAPAAPQPTTAMTTAPERITAKHWYQDGVHTIAGEVQLASSCDLLNASATTTAEGPRVDFTVLHSSPNGTCTVVTTPARFALSFPASENAKINAFWGGTSVILNLVEAGPGETPANYRIFEKG